MTHLFNIAAQIERVKQAFLTARYGTPPYTTLARAVAQVTAEEFVAMHRAAHDDAPCEAADADTRTEELARCVERGS